MLLLFFGVSDEVDKFYNPDTWRVFWISRSIESGKYGKYGQLSYLNQLFQPSILIFAGMASNQLPKVEQNISTL
jgi:hypothetical protein